MKQCCSECGRPLKGPSRQLRLAMDWLASQLAKGPVSSKRIIDRCEFPEPLLRRAYRSLGVESERSGIGPTTKVYWSLPSKWNQNVKGN